MTLYLKIFFYFCFILLPINCQQNKKSIGIHQTQSMYFQNKKKPISEKITVRNGIDVLLEKKLHFIQSRKIALVTNHSGVDKNSIPNYKRLMEIDDVELKVIFSPEHGLFGESEAGEKINYTDIEKLPKVISLYGGTRKPSAEMLEGVNLIIYDIQAVSYTHLTLPTIYSV